MSKDLRGAFCKGSQTRCTLAAKEFKERGSTYMERNIIAIAPDDDSGSPTFVRYRYQAEIALRYCLDCGLGGHIKSVILEHHEDIVIELPDTWRFMQIKTRDASRGAWRLSDLLAPNGALHSLFRTHKKVGHIKNVRYIAGLEGRVATDDALLRSLTTEEGRSSPQLIKAVAKKLKIPNKECATFLSRLEVVDGLPSRDAIRAKNFRYIGTIASHLTHGQTESFYDSFLAKIENAMGASVEDENWHKAIFSPNSAADEAKQTVALKRLTPAVLAPLLGTFKGPPSVLLELASQLPYAGMSDLEEKLQAGGATIDVIEAAKELRAKASIIEYEHASRDLSGKAGALLNDVRARLKIRYEAIKLINKHHNSPAIYIWAELMATIAREATQLDPNSVFNRDAYLLQGELCVLADMCIVDFGVAHA